MAASRDVSRKEIQEARNRPVPHAEGGEPVDPNVHTRWERHKGQNIRDRENEGYKIATPEDVVENHIGHVTPENQIRRGDLILMKCNREYVEDRERERQEDMAYQERKQAEEDEAHKISKLEGHGKRRGRKYYSMS